MMTTVTDNTIKAFLANDPSTLIVASSTCNRCIAYIAEVRAMQEGGAPGATSAGVLMLDQPGVGQFRRDNLWLASEELLPDTLLYRRGRRVDGFLSGRGHFLLDYSRQLELPEPELV